MSAAYPREQAMKKTKLKLQDVIRGKTKDEMEGQKEFASIAGRDSMPDIKVCQQKNASI
jgi:hypothetical protein